MKKDVIKQLIIWVICLIIFVVSLYIGGIQNGPFNENPSLAKDIAFVSIFASILIGALSFIFLMYKFVEFSVKDGEGKKKGGLKSVLIFLITAPIFPLYILVVLIKSFISRKPKIKDNRWLVLLLNIFIIAPVWFVTYTAGYYIATDEIFLGTRYQISTMNDMNSMAPSFPGKSIHKYYPYKNIFYKLNKPYQFKRGDVVSFSNEITKKSIALNSEPNYFFLKRIIGLPGDTIEIKGGGVFVNNKYFEEAYTLEPNSTFSLPGEYKWSKENKLEGLFLEECQKVTVPENSLFVLGDNRKNSDDSRIFGFVNFDDIRDYLPIEEQKITYYEGVNPLNHSEKWRDTTEDSANLQKSGLIKCKI
jgi:signal peptidase I